MSGAYAIQHSATGGNCNIQSQHQLPMTDHWSPYRDHLEAEKKKTSFRWVVPMLFNIVPQAAIVIFNHGTNSQWQAIGVHTGTISCKKVEEIWKDEQKVAITNKSVQPHFTYFTVECKQSTTTLHRQYRKIWLTRTQLEEGGFNTSINKYNNKVIKYIIYLIL
jgi:hypothetical protein